MHYESIVNTEKTTLGFVFETLFMNGVKSTIKLKHPMQENDITLHPQHIFMLLPLGAVGEKSFSDPTSDACKTEVKHN